MKKYIAPATKLIFLDPAESMMTLTGSNGGLDGAGYGGNTSTNNIKDADSNRRNNSIWGDAE